MAPNGKANPRTTAWSRIEGTGRIVFLATVIVLGTVACLGHIKDNDEEISDRELDAAEEELAKRKRHTFGLGVDANIAITDHNELYLHLKGNANNGWIERDWKLRAARTVYYARNTGTEIGNEKSDFKKWLNTVYSDKNSEPELEPMVAVSVQRLDANGEKTHPVTKKQFRSAFKKLIEKYTKVSFWSINEPDLDLGIIKDRKKRAVEAAKYFVIAANELRQCKRSKKCSKHVGLVAGEFSYKASDPQASKKIWINYRNALIEAKVNGLSIWNDEPKVKLHTFPHIWALHPYFDTSKPSTSATKDFIRVIKDTEDKIIKYYRNKINLKKGSLRVWLTETGAILRNGKDSDKMKCQFMNTDNPDQYANINNKPHRQFRAARNIFRLNDIKLKGDVPRVDRIYWWEFKQNDAWLDTGGEVRWHDWDSALIDYKGMKRPSFCALTNPDRSYSDPIVQACMNLHPPTGEPIVELAAGECDNSGKVTTADPSPSDVDAPSPSDTGQPPPPEVEDPPSIPVYRWVNGSWGDHFYTNDPAGEIASTTGYTYEGIGFSTFACDTPGTSPFFRWWNNDLTDHFYTEDPSDGPAFFGYVREGNIGCIAGIQSGRSVPLHRWWDPVLADHFYTIDPNGEIAALLGYQYEQVAGYVLPPE